MPRSIVDLGLDRPVARRRGSAAARRRRSPVPFRSPASVGQVSTPPRHASPWRPGGPTTSRRRAWSRRTCRSPTRSSRSGTGVAASFVTGFAAGRALRLSTSTPAPSATAPARSTVVVLPAQVELGGGDRVTEPGVRDLGRRAAVAHLEGDGVPGVGAEAVGQVGRCSCRVLCPGRCCWQPERPGLRVDAHADRARTRRAGSARTPSPEDRRSASTRAEAPTFLLDDGRRGRRRRRSRRSAGWSASSRCRWSASAPGRPSRTRSTSGRRSPGPAAGRCSGRDRRGRPASPSPSPAGRSASAAG